MGKMGSVGFINSFIGEVRNTHKEQVALREKRADKAQKDELFKLKKREYELDIKERERTGEVTPFDAKKLISDFKDYSQLIEAKSKVGDAILDGAQTETMKKQQNLNSIARQIMPKLTIATDKEGKQSSSMSFNTVSGNRNKSNNPTESDKVLGNLSIGGITQNDSTFNEFVSKTDMEGYAASNLGPDYKERYPRSQEFIDKKFPDIDDFGFKVGEKRQVTGKGTFEYAGDNQWKKVR